MLEFFRRLFAPEPRSSETAKERLRLVLLSDHLSLAPDVVEALKRDLLAVISRYLEIDPALADVTFEQREREVAMLASIPIMGVRERVAAAAAPVATIPAPAEHIAVAAPDPAPVTPEAAAAVEAAAGPAPEVEPQTQLEPGNTSEVVAGGGALIPDGVEGEAAPLDGEAEPQGVPEAPPVPRLEAMQTADGHAQTVPTSSAARRRRRKKAAAAANRALQTSAPGLRPA